MLGAHYFQEQDGLWPDFLFLRRLREGGIVLLRQYVRPERKGLKSTCDCLGTGQASVLSLGYTNSFIWTIQLPCKKIAWRLLRFLRWGLDAAMHDRQFLKNSRTKACYGTASLLSHHLVLRVAHAIFVSSAQESDKTRCLLVPHASSGPT